MLGSISVIQVTAINAGRVLALADVELILDGVSFSEQARLVRAIGSPRDEPASY
jgi:stage V sporulation protein G